MGYGVVITAIRKTFWRNFKWKVFAIPIILGAITFTAFESLEIPSSQEVSVEGQVIIDGQPHKIQNSTITVNIQKESFAIWKIILSFFPLLTFLVDILSLAVNPKNYGPVLYGNLEEIFDKTIKSTDPRYNNLLGDLRSLRAQLLNGQVQKEEIEKFLRECQS